MNHAVRSPGLIEARAFFVRRRLTSILRATLLVSRDGARFPRAALIGSIVKMPRCFLLIFIAHGPRDGIAEPAPRLDSGCPKPDAPEHGEMFVLWSGLLVQFRCSGDYKLVGPAAIICRNRTWTQEPPACLDERQLAELASHGDGE